MATHPACCYPNSYSHCIHSFLSVCIEVHVSNVCCKDILVLILGELLSSWSHNHLDLVIKNLITENLSNSMSYTKTIYPIFFSPRKISVLIVIPKLFIPSISVMDEQLWFWPCSYVQCNIPKSFGALVFIIACHTTFSTSLMHHSTLTCISLVYHFPMVHPMKLEILEKKMSMWKLPRLAVSASCNVVGPPMLYICVYKIEECE